MWFARAWRRSPCHECSLADMCAALARREVEARTFEAAGPGVPKRAGELDGRPRAHPWRVPAAA
jgi:hypothetical protein